MWSNQLAVLALAVWANFLALTTSTFSSAPVLSFGALESSFQGQSSNYSTGTNSSKHDLPPYPHHRHGPTRRAINFSSVESVKANKFAGGKYFETFRFDYWNALGHMTKVYDPVSYFKQI